MLLLLLLLLISLSLILLLLLLLLLFIIYYYYHYRYYIIIIIIPPGHYFDGFRHDIFFSFCSSIARPVTSRCHCYQDHARYTDTRHKIHGNEFPRRIIIGFSTTRKCIYQIYLHRVSPPPPLLIFNDRFQFCFIFRSKKKIECDYLFIFFLPILPGGYVIFFAWIA